MEIKLSQDSTYHRYRNFLGTLCPPYRLQPYAAISSCPRARNLAAPFNKSRHRHRVTPGPMRGSTAQHWHWSLLPNPQILLVLVYISNHPDDHAEAGSVSPIGEASIRLRKERLSSIQSTSTSCHTAFHFLSTLFLKLRALLHLSFLHKPPPPISPSGWTTLP